MADKVIVLGSSGHARSVACVLEDLNYEVVGFVDSFRPPGEPVLRYKTLGDEHVMRDCQRRYGTRSVVVGVGDILSRKRVVQLIREINPDVVFPTIVSPHAKVSHYASLGEGTVVLSHALVNVECLVGCFCVLNSASLIEHNTRIGDYCSISPGANIGANVSVGEGVFIGSSATLIQRRSVGAYSVIGAGAVVTQDLPDHVLAVGVPAVVKRENYVNVNIFR